MSHLVRPHLISIAVIALLILLLLIWPAEQAPESAATSVQRANVDTDGELRQKSQAIPVLPPIQLLQPDPGLTDEELFESSVAARRCRDVPKTKESLDQWLAQANDNDELPERITRILNAFESCQSVDAAYDYMNNFKLLAQKGHEQALWSFWNLSDSEVFRLKGIHKLNRDAIIAARQEFQLNKYQLAEQHLMMGNERAMMRLMYAYQHLDPATGGQNYIRSLALANLVMDVSKDQDNYRRADWHKQFMERRMDTDEIDAALEMAQKIAEDLAR